MDNSELSRRITEIAVHLDRVEQMAQWLIDRAQRPPILPVGVSPAPAEAPAPAASVGWPWAPATDTQGFLAGKFERRDGDVYGAAATQADANINSPIAGGDDAQAQIDVPSGAPRSG
jgi:hypothetical protein